MNNGDKIRKMSNKELCKFMSRMAEIDTTKVPGIYVPELDDFLDYDKLMDYLDTEIDEEDVKTSSDLKNEKTPVTFMKVCDLLDNLRTEAIIEVREDNTYLFETKSNSKIMENYQDREINDWFLGSVCANTPYQEPKIVIDLLFEVKKDV